MKRPMQGREREVWEEGAEVEGKGEGQGPKGRDKARRGGGMKKK